MTPVGQISPQSAANLNNTSGLGGQTLSPPNEVAVKVAVRVRPLNSREKLHQHQPCVRIASETNQLVIGKDKQFSFDYVLAPKISQKELYETCVRPLVHNMFDGYNATVFAYGQTGSGKTYTISGNKTSGEEYGIIPRAVSNMFQIMSQNGGVIFSQSNANSNKNSMPVNRREYCIKVNFIEIYKEEVKDLLDATPKSLHIREDDVGNTVISGANEVICGSLEEVMACFDSGTLLRHTGSTLMNEQSSRSHSVFTVSVEQRWTETAAKSLRESAIYDINGGGGAQANNMHYLGAKFHFVDLAGSERVHRTGNVGDRFKESIHINSGLLVLGNVISALSAMSGGGTNAGDVSGIGLGSASGKRGSMKTIHIPYRDSKITRILKDSLGGNANTLMICCISPSSCNLDESLNAVKYASRARNIKNKPIVNMDSHTKQLVEMESELKALREEVSRQRSAHHQHSHYEEELKQLESRVESAQLEADFYKKLVKEAYGRFKQLSTTSANSAVPTASQQNHVKKIVDEWLSMFEASKNRADFDMDDFIKQRITQLETQLRQAQDDLKSDEEIFSEKEKEISQMKESIRELESKISMANRCLEASLNKEKEQQELMLQMQLQIDRLMQQPSAKQDSNNKLNDDSGVSKMSSPSSVSSLSSKTTTLSSTTTQKQPVVMPRAKTAPQTNQDEKSVGGNSGGSEQKNPRAAAYSSPAQLTMEKFMQSFRARSQLLAETLEDNDCVLQQQATGNKGVGDLIDDEGISGGDNELILVENDGPDSDTENGQFVRKGTFKVNKPKSKQSLANVMEFDQRADSAIGQDKKLREMAINIKMKEELIKELVANSKFTNRINLQYQQKIELLQKENVQLKAEVDELQRSLQHLHRSSPTMMTTTTPLGSAKESKAETELRKKLEQAQQKIADLEMRQANTTKQMNATMGTEKRMNELEINLGKARQQVEQLQKKLKEEGDKRLKVEKDLEKEQQRARELEMKAEKQQTVLKKKSEDLVTAQRRLRIGSASGASNDREQSPSTKQHWVEQEMEKILSEKQQMEQLRDELAKREELVRKKELLMQEKSQLEVKKLRASQQQHHQNANLEETHNQLVKQKRQLDEKLSKGDVLSPNEERRLIEIEEAIEALEVAIDFENESIREQEDRMRDSILLTTSDSAQISENVLGQLSSVPVEETKILLKRFFQRIIDLKELENKRQSENNELKVQIEEQTRAMEQLKQALNGGLKDQKSHQKQLISQLSESQSKMALMEREMSMYKEKLAQLNLIKQANQATNHYQYEDQQNSTNSTGFYLKSESSNGLNGVGDQSSSTSSTPSVKVVKVSRKDLRRLTEEEVMKRSINKKDSDN